MKKNLFSTLFAALVLFVAMPATAKVNSIADLYGKYKFTATITPTDEGKSFTNYWKSECEVIIARDKNNDIITGILGAPKEQLIAGLDAETGKFWVNNPNPNKGLLDGSKYIGVSDLTLENIELYTMEYYYDAETKEITIPEFSICQFSWPGDSVMTAKELAKVTHAKLVPIGDEGDDPEMSEVQWEGIYDVKGTIAMVGIEDFTYPEEFEMEVVYNEKSDIYLVTKFLGYDTSALNYGGIPLTPSADNPNKAEIGIKSGGFLQAIEAGVSYLCLRDGNLSDSPLMLTRNEDGTYVISDFCISYMVYNSQEYKLAAWYRNVTAVKAEEDAVESIVVEEANTVGVFNLLGRKLDAITAPGLYIVNGKKVVIK